MKSHLSLTSVITSLTVIILTACGTPPANPTLTLPTQAAVAPTNILPTVAPTIAPTSVPPTVAPTAVPPSRVPLTSIPPTVAPTLTLSPTLTLANQIKDGFVSSFGWAADNITFTARTESAITHYTAADLKPTTIISPTFAAQIYALSQDGSKVFGMASDNTYKVWSTTDGRVLATIANTSGPLPGAGFTPDGSMLATFGGDQIEVQLWDAKTGKFIKSLTGFETAAPVYSAIFSPDNKTMAWISRATVQFMEVDSGALGAKLSFEDFVSAAQFTPDSKSFVTLDVATVNNQPNGVVQVWNVNDGRLQQQLTTPEFFSGLSVSPQGNLLAVGVDKNIELWDWKVGGGASSITTPGQISTLAFSNDGKMLVTGDQDSNLGVWTVTP